MSPTRDEQRQAVLGNLATHGQVQWHTRGADIAFADDVLELAAPQGADAHPRPPLRRSQRVPQRVGTVTHSRPVRATDGRRSDAPGERAHGRRHGGTAKLTGRLRGKR